MGAISIEIGKLNKNSKDEKTETWKHQAFLAAYRRLFLALVLSLVLPISSLIVVFFTKDICVQLDATHSRDWARMGLTLVPHLVSSVVILGLTPSLTRPLQRKQKWSDLAELTKGLAYCAVYLFLLVSFLTVLELCKLNDFGHDNSDDCRHVVRILVNWIGSLFLTLLTVRVNCDHTRAAMSLEALEILEWDGQRNGECKVEVTNAVKKSYGAQMVKIYEYMCVGRTVAEMAYAHTRRMAAIVLLGLFFWVIHMCYDFTGINLLLSVCMVAHFWHYCCALVAIKEKRNCLTVYSIFFVQLYGAGYMTDLVASDPNLTEFVLRSMRYWSGDAQPAAVPGTMWAKESVINDAHVMVSVSLMVMAGSTFALFLLHSIYSLFFYLSNQSPAAPSPKTAEAKKLPLLVDSAENEETKKLPV